MCEDDKGWDIQMTPQIIRRLDYLTKRECLRLNALCVPCRWDGRHVRAIENHHIISRRCMSTRFYGKNNLSVCRNCHNEAGKSRPDFYRQLVAHGWFTFDEMDALIIMSKKIIRLYDADEARVREAINSGDVY